MRHSDASITDRVDRTFAVDVRAGLTKKGQKDIPAKYLYDDIGSALFEVITLLPEYGLTRADTGLLKQHAPEISNKVEASVVVELGSGGGGKARWILEEMALKRSVLYSPIDVSSSALRRGFHELSEIQGIQIVPIEALYEDGLKAAIRMRPRGTPALVLFLGSSIGNLNHAEAENFLRGIRRQLEPSDWFLLSADLQKDRQRMVAAYDDSIGVTAAFNLNILARINRELAGDFDLSRFEHTIRYNEREHRIEMHLRSKADQVVSIGPLSVGFREGETIWTESSYKFTPEGIRRLARKCGFRCVTQWLDHEWPFAQSLLRAV
jgi:L-histidine Nalpha-methyltransferase